MIQKVKAQVTRDNVMKYLPYILPALVAALMFATAGSSFAQEVTLDIDTSEMTSRLFEGANIIIAALGAVMFLLAGFKLGGILIRGIVDAISGIRF